MQVFVIHHFHVVALLCAHRNASTPSQKDFVLASKLTDPAKMQKSVEHAEAEAVLLEKPRKRLRRMAVNFEFEAVAAEVADQQPQRPEPENVD